ncbi:hypothetical protein BDW60DRAFT_5002 [Aspergillus nidulans var. acristatus]
MASITCHRHLPPGPGGYDHYVHHHNNDVPPLHLAASTLAAPSSAPLCSDPKQDPSSISTSLAVPVPVASLDISCHTSTAAAASEKPHSSHSFDLAGRVYILSETRLSGEPKSTRAANGGMVDPSSPLPASDKLRTPERRRTVSPSTRSSGEIRSTSRSTRRSGGGNGSGDGGHSHSRRSSLHSHRRTVTTTSLTPSRPDSPVRRENLIALHRESCRLFQDNSLASTTAAVTRQSSFSSSPPYTPRQARTYSNVSSPPVTPILERHQSSTLRHSHSSSNLHANHETVPVSRVEVNLSTKTKPTIIEWTSPSTRRREYREIDRASSGVRGLWRRVAPRWCQFGDKRVPFFEEGKDGKANYEGSVRRFRMDLPDELEPGEYRNQCRRGFGLKLKPRLVVQIKRGKTSMSWL